MSATYHLSSPLSLVSELEVLSLDKLVNTTSVSDSSLMTLPNSSDNYWFQAFYGYWRREADPRSINYPLFGDGIVPLTAIMTVYFLFVTTIGPWIMSKRSAFELRGPMLTYNILMVAFNAYFFFKFVSLCDFGRAFLKFEFPNKTDRSEAVLALIDTSYYYFLTKFVDLLDTIFFVLRKKNRQITGLHLYHHTSVPFLLWLAMKLRPTVPAYQLFGILNSFVHTVMYSYYALSSFGPSIQPYLWWKRYITQIQLAQFVILIAYGVVLGRLQTEYPPIWFWIGFIQNPLFFFLFYDFYRQSYNKKKVVNNKKVE